MSIFLKTCPKCATSQALAATRCDCGYRFGADEAQGHPEIELIAEEEKLYQEYLTARAAQAKEELAIARSACASDPQNGSKSARFRNAEQAFKAIQTDLAEQNARTEAAAAVARKLRIGARKARIEQSKLGLVKSAAPKPAPAPARNTPPIPHRAKFAKRATETPGQQPDEAFRAHQAAKAEQALKQARVTAEERLRALRAGNAKTASPMQTPAPAPMPTSTPVRVELPSAAKAVARAAQRIGPGKKQCPNCTAAVAEPVNRCRCGYAFPVSGPEIPGIALDTTTLPNRASNSGARGIGRRS